MRRVFRGTPVPVALLAVVACNGGPAARPDPERVFQSERHDFRVEIVSDGFEHPWSLAFLSPEEALVSERPGRLQRIALATGERTEITGLPEIAALGQGGLLDVALHPAFEENGWIYFTYAAAGDDGPGTFATQLARARLEGDRLSDLEVLFVAAPFVGGGRHFGSRIAFDRDGYLFFTVGERGQREESQQRGNALGATIRLTADGAIPDDNPFAAEEEAHAAVYAYGQRNVQGMAVHPETGRIWQHEHGPRGGDEINLLQARANFGWPRTSYGVEYLSRRSIGPSPHEHAGTVAPVHFWADSFAPSGMAFYEGDRFGEWQGDLFVGSLAREYLARLSLEGEQVVSEEALLADLGWRVRDVRIGPDEALYLLIDARNAPLVRLVPAVE